MLLPFNRFLGWFLVCNAGFLGLLAVAGVVATYFQGRALAAAYWGAMVVVFASGFYFFLLRPGLRARSLARERAGASGVGLAIAGSGGSLVDGDSGALMRWRRPTEAASLVVSSARVEIVSARSGEVTMALPRSGLADIEAVRPLHWPGYCSVIHVRTVDGGTVYFHVLNGGLSSLIGPSEKYVEAAVMSIREVLDL